MQKSSNEKNKYERHVKDDALSLECRIWGHAPVQAEGTVAGKQLYFRARHDEWTFSVALSEDVDPADVQYLDQGFFRAEPYGTSFNSTASYMPYDDAEMFIRRCAQEFINLQPD